MRDLIFKNKFSKDVERIKRTGRDMSRLAEAIDLLAEGKPMPPNNRDHPLVGNFKDYRECHLGGDWLLLYQLTDESVIFAFAQAVTRTFSTSENLKNETPNSPYLQSTLRLSHASSPQQQIPWRQPKP